MPGFGLTSQNAKKVESEYMALNKPIDQITIDDLNYLVSAKEDEKQIVDYKSAIKLEISQNKEEFRKDISSFANASGGDYILGIDEEKGIAVNLCGMQLDNPDAFKLRLEEILQSNIQPRIPGVQIRQILLRDDRYVVIIRVPRSFVRPHQVKLNKDDYQFWARNAAGKYRLDVDQLRTAFLLSETLEERIRGFRQDRLGSVIAGETPIPMSNGPKLVLHLVPLNAFDSTSRYDISQFDSARGLNSSYVEQRTPKMVWPLETNSLNERFNFDGILSFCAYSAQRGNTDSFVQFYRNGILEIVNTGIVDIEIDEAKILSLTHIEKVLVDALPDYLSFQRELGIDVPILVMLSLVGVKGRSIPTSVYSFRSANRPVDRDILVVPEVLVEGSTFDAGSILRPIFDVLWNACGRSVCPNYDEHGTWRPAPVTMFQ